MNAYLMKAIYKHCLVVLLVLPGLTNVNAALWECGERSNLPQQGKNYCAASDFRQSAHILKELFVALQNTHEQRYGDSKTLSEAQGAYAVYRDQQCNAENKCIEDEPFHPMIVAQCKTRLNNLRINEIKRMLERS